MTREDGGRVREGPAGGHSVSWWQDGIRTPVCPMGPALPPETGLRCHRQRPDLVGRPEGLAPPARPRCPAMAILWSPSLGSRASPGRRWQRFPLSPLQTRRKHTGRPRRSVGSLRRCRVARPGSTQGELTSSPRRPRPPHACRPRDGAPRGPAGKAPAGPGCPGEPLGQLPLGVTRVSALGPEPLARQHRRGHRQWTRRTFIVEAALGLVLASKARAEERSGPKRRPVRRDSGPSTWQRKVAAEVGSAVPQRSKAANTAPRGPGCRAWVLRRIFGKVAWLL